MKAFVNTPASAAIIQLVEDTPLSDETKECFEEFIVELGKRFFSLMDAVNQRKEEERLAKYLSYVFGDFYDFFLSSSPRYPNEGTEDFYGALGFTLFDQWYLQAKELENCKPENQSGKSLN